MAEHNEKNGSLKPPGRTAILEQGISSELPAGLIKPQIAGSHRGAFFENYWPEGYYFLLFLQLQLFL